MAAAAPARTLLHGTAIALDGHAALIRGPSGAGKSDLALRCLTATIRQSDGRVLAADLVADDQVVAEQHDDGVWLSAPSTIRDRIEIRGVGIRPWRAIDAARLVVVVDLVAPDDVERVPDARTVTVLASDVPLLQLAPFEASAPTKLLLELARLADARA
jgi:serine kinase of HPr protein (carbohydrate metabolism regulator)